MSVVRHSVKRGAYHDSVVLMQLQRKLGELDGVEQVGVVMATPANLALLAESGLRVEKAEARSDDLLIAVQAKTAAAARDALARFDELAASRRSAAAVDYRPKSLATAFVQQADAQWVLVSVPGEYAAAVARQALDGGRHVFLYSDNVSIEDEVALKQRATERGLMVLGPDCGTALVGGVGLGFANRVRRGPVGVVAASGTGLQMIACRVHARGSGISHGIGTGGRDLSREVAGRTALQALRALAADPETGVIVLVSKPPHPEVVARLLAAAASLGKPVVVHFQGEGQAGRRLGPLHFAADLEDAADLAVDLTKRTEEPFETDFVGALRGLFSGGTLASEALLRLEPLLPEISSNLDGPSWSGVFEFADVTGHAILDLGADQFTLGRPHPMIDPRLVVDHLAHCATDAEVGTVMLDVVLGDGAHPDPASIFAPAIKAALESRKGDFAVVAVIVGTDEDPQEVARQRAEIEAAGALVVESLGEALETAVRRALPAPDVSAGVDAGALVRPAAAINVGVELFRDSLADQGVAALQVDWRPPAGGNDRLAGILARLRQSE